MELLKAHFHEKALGLAAGILGTVDYLIMVLYGSYSSTGLTKDLLLEYIPGFTWLTPLSFVWGLVFAFVAYFVCGYIFAWLYNVLSKKM